MSIDPRCKAEAIDMGTDRHIRCQLLAGHMDWHFWRIRVKDELLSASWYGPSDGLPQFIGTRGGTATPGPTDG